MPLIYRTDGAWGVGKGSNLAPAEVDSNFYDLEGRITYIEDNPVMPIEPISITIAGYNFYMGLSNGETLGPVVMTMPVPEWRGEWTPATQYHDMDFFTAPPPDGGFGAVMLGHTSAATFDWAALSGDGLPLYRLIVGGSGGTVALSDLTDVALAGIATGDMLVWDGASSYWRNLDPAEVAAQFAVFQGDTGAGGAQGMVPAPAAGDAAAHKFLSASGAWVVPATGSGGSASLAGLTDVSINSPVNDSLLQYKAGDGKWHNSSLLDLGAGTVTSITAGTGLSGGTITATGTVALAPVPTATLLANTATGSAPPAPASLTVALDALAGSTRGSLLQRNAVGWQPLAPGTAGLFLRTGGSGADLTWASPAGNGTVTSITAGAGLSGGTITTSGTIGLNPIADDRLLANVSGGSSPPTETSVTALLDATLGTTRGSIIRRDGSAWNALAPGTAGHVLTTGGTGADVSWAPGGGTGASVSIGDAPPVSPDPGDLWWDSAGGQLYLWYNDGSSAQFVPATNMPGPQGPAGATGPAGSANMTCMAAGQIPIAASATSVTSSGNLSGDVTTNATLVATLATVNPNVGTFQGLVLDGKGRVTAASNQGYLPAATAAATYLALAGGTTTGDVTIGGNLWISGSNTLRINGVVFAGNDALNAGYNKLYDNSGTTSIFLGNGAGTGNNVYQQAGHLFNNRSGTLLARFDAGGCAKPGGGTWADSSDARVKKNVLNYETGLDAIVKLRPVSFQFNGKGETPTDDKTYVGLVANEAQEIMPEMVGTSEVEFERGDLHLTEILTLDATPMLYALVNAVRELAAKVAALEAKR